MNTIVNFELAKLLKEKGFDEKIYTRYVLDSHKNTYRSDYPISDIEMYAPTIAEVVMWLFKTREIWIEVYYDNSRKEFYTVLNGEEYKFNSPIEAYEVAILYSLNNLI